MSRSLIELAGGIVLAVALALPLTGAAQSQDDSAKQQAERQLTQPGNNAPVWREIRSGDPAYTSIKGQEVNVLIQPTMKLPGQPALTGGEAWRLFRNGVITPFGGWLLAAVVVVIGAIYAWKGAIKVHEKPTGRLIERFTPVQRYAHWVVGISFVILAITGIVILLGKYLLLPVIGHTLFAWLTSLLKNLHNFVGPLFAISLLFFIVVRLQVVRELRRDVRRQARAVGPLQRRREGLVLDRGRGAVDHRQRDRFDPELPELRPGPCGDDPGEHHPCDRGRACDRARARPHLHGDDRGRGRLPVDAQWLRRRVLGQGAPPALVRGRQVGQGQGRQGDRHAAVGAGPALRRDER
jgi:uncharacterized membrane protein